MQYEKKAFWHPATGGGDFDSAFYAVKPNKWVNASNIRTLTTDFGETNTVESLGANVLKNNPQLPAGTNVFIGHAVDESGSRIVYFIWNSNGNHAIFCYDVLSEVIYLVLANSQVTGGLNFGKNNIIHSTRYVNGCIYWTDELNEPRRIDVDAGIKLNQPSYITTKAPYVAPLSQSVISIIRRQPGLPPTQTKIYQTTPSVTNNFIAKEAFLFCYRYVYRNYETSTLSALSMLCNYNGNSDLFNRVDVAIPFAERIEQDVIQIDLVAVYLQTNTYQIINSWLTSNAADAAAIAAHNAGTTQLTFPFYNDTIGITLDQAYSVKPFDSVPLICKTLETAKNRLFLANNKMGYTAPSITSLAPSFTLTTYDPNVISNPTGEWILLKYRDIISGTGDYSRYLLRTTTPLGTESPAPTYYYEYSSPVPPFPISVNESDLTFVGSNAVQIANHYGQFYPFNISFTDQGVSAVIVTGATPTSNVIGKAFKSDAPYQLSITFYDNAGRKCGLVTNSNCIVRIPDTGLLSDQYVVSLSWALSNSNALIEIPDWAYYYSVNITKCLRTRYFIQCIGQVIYAKKDTSNVYTFTTTTYSTDLAGVAIDLTFLQSNSMGYSFQEGDIVKLVIGTNEYILSIIDQAAQYIICQLQDVGNFATATTGLFEIYTPYKRQSNEPNYEIGELFQVVNPTTNTRSYGTLNGVINGDVYLIRRTNNTSNYIAEAMNIQDKFYQNWFTDSGRPNFIDTIGQQQKSGSISYSNTFIQGSKTNGLSTFDALDTKDIYPECGVLQKLQLTSKVAGEIGSIMLGICTKETVSLYMGETQVMSNVSNAFVAQSDSVIGTINVLKGTFGTRRPESVVEVRGNVFWVDDINGKVVQYSANGLFPISNYEASKFWKLFCAQFNSMTQDQIEALGDRPFIFATVDPHNWELLISVPKTLAVPPKGYLPDYPNEVYPFDIWDGQGKTMVYKLNAQPNHWSGSYPFNPEGMVYIQNKVFSAKQGQLYEHNSDVFPCMYYGQLVKARIMFTLNQIPNRPKVYNNVSVEGNMRPSLVYLRSEPGLVDVEKFDLQEQASDLMDFDFEDKEGNLYASIYRNKLQPTATGMNLNGLLTGDKMRALALLCMLEFDPKSSPLELRFVTFGFSISAGHST